jgi:hypothetical protein
MKVIAAIFVVLAIAFLSGCRVPRSEEIRALTQTDCEAIYTIVVQLCERYIPPQQIGSHLPPDYLFGEDIPKELLFLKPQAVRMGKSFIAIYLYKSPAGEDSIFVYKDEGGDWTIRTRQGTWKNEPKIIWSSVGGWKPSEPRQGSAARRIIATDRAAHL